MAFIIKDRVKENTITTGTGSIDLGGATATFDTFQSYMTNGDTSYYAIVHTSSGVDEWEVGLGTWNTGNTLTRTTILAGSNGLSAQNFSAGNKDVFMTYPASHAALADDDVSFANITVTGTVDGRDVAADGTKLDGIDTSADVTDAVTVAAAGALMKSGGTMTGALILSSDPTTALGAATKEYVDTIAAAGIHYHTPVRVEAPSALSATYNNGSSGVGATLTNTGTNAAIVIDGVALSLNDRVLVYNQTNPAHNGIYIVTTVGDGSTAWVLTRSTDADSYGVSDPNSFGEGDAFFVKEGNTGAGELYVMNTSGTITFGTTAINFTVIAETAVYSAGTGISLDGTTFSIGQAVGTSDSVTFNQVTADIIGNVTGDVIGDVTGNADTASALATARTIQLTGDVTGSVSFDGSANASITAVVQDDSHSHVISNVDGLQTALDAKAPTSRTITAGNGLTGGGDLTANRTFTVGGGTGVTVNANDISIGQDVATTSSPTFANATFTGDVTIGDDLFVTGSSPIITLTDNDNADNYTKLRNSGGNTYLDSRSGASNGPIIFRGQGGGVDTQYGRFNGAGHFGIGDNSPSEKLSVTGNIAATGNVTAAGGTFTNTTAAEAGLTVAGDTANGWGLEIATHTAGTASDLVLNGNAVVGHGTSVSYTIPTAGYYRWMTGATSNTGGTAGSSEKMRLTDTGNLTVTGNIAATGTVDGRDVATDGTKLDGIEAGATADQTAAQLLAKIKTVDVNGTAGLNAGTLDGHALTSASTGSTVVERDANGDIKARLFRSEYDYTNSDCNYFMTQIDTGTDNYLRPSTVEQVQTKLNVLLKSGGTMTGNLTVSGGLTVPSGASINFNNDDSISYNDTTNTFSFNKDGGTANANISASNLTAAGGLTVDGTALSYISRNGSSEQLRLGYRSGGTNNLDAFQSFYRDGTTRIGYLQARSAGMRFKSDGGVMFDLLSSSMNLTGDLVLGSEGTTSTSTRKLTVESIGYAVLDLSGDRSNTSGEPGGAGVALRVDGTGLNAVVSYVNNAGSDGIGGSYTGATAHSLLLGTTTLADIEFGRGASVTMVLGSNSLRPNTDGTLDLGNNSHRWEQLFAGTTTIATSDINMKQDIEELSEAETRVAQACKGLMRKYRFKDAVERKGDDARIHVGIMAQDLQAAFAAEGLDASRYSVFCSDTWFEEDIIIPARPAVDEELDEEGNVTTEAREAVPETTQRKVYTDDEEVPETAREVTQLGVRYSELFAFIISAL